MCSCLMSSEPIPKEERASLPFDRDNELVSLTVDVLDLDAWVAVKHTAQLGHIDIHATLGEGIIMRASRLRNSPDHIECMATLQGLISEETKQGQ